MDSLTQFVLGAAVGEATLGRKLGNTAILLGGIFGTIPDLDVMLNPFVSDLQGLQVHRGISHSIFFAVLFGLLSAWLLKNVFFKRKSDLDLKHWWLFTFLALFTHGLLDSFTSYGTQLFAPFSNYRVAFNNIFVADLFYTLPFLICLIIAMFYHRRSERRRFFNYFGIGLSSLYMLFTIGVKLYTNQVFKQSLNANSIQYDRFTSSPTPLNAFLWSTVAETKDAFYIGHYSIFDSDNEIEYTKLDKNDELRKKFDTVPGFDILTWFSKDYFVLTKADGHTAYVDLRFGPMDYQNIDRMTSYPFFFKINIKDNYLDVLENIEPPEFGSEEFNQYFKRFIKRVGGNKGVVANYN